MKIGIVKECKIPHDYRVPFTPEQLAYIQDTYGVPCVVQPSDIRCFADDDYTRQGINLQDDLSDCHVIFGVKEIPVENLINGKTYYFFAHVTKAQPHNQNLMGALIDKNITMVDYELLTHANGMRILGFGHQAGIVGAYNGLKVYGDKTGDFQLPLAHTLSGLDELYDRVSDLQNLDMRIMSTGAGGRVSGGIVSVLEKTNLKPLSPPEYLQDYLSNTQSGVYTVLAPMDYMRRTDDAPMVEAEFFADPTPFISNFLPYAQHSNMYIAGHFWDNRAPAFFTMADIADPATFPIDIISDISCDLDGPIPTTVRTTTLEDIAYDIHRTTGTEHPALSETNGGANAITVTAVDNLPSAIAKDSSHAFGQSLLTDVIPTLVAGSINEGDDNNHSTCINRATICTAGQLTENYQYLSTYAGI